MRKRICLISHIYPTSENKIKGSFIKEFVEQMTKAECDFNLCVIRKRILIPVLLPVKFLFYKITKQPDIIHAHFGVPSGFLAALSKGKTPLVTTIHRVEVKNPVLKQFIPFTVRRSDVVICVSDSIRRDVVDLSGEQSNIITLHNAIDLNKIKKTKNPNLRKKLRIPEDAIIISTIGFFEARKKFDLLIDACVDIVKDYNCYVIIAGSGQCKEEYEQIIDENNLNQKVLLIGEVFDNNKIGLLLESEIFVFPSLSEGHSIAILEAMACENAVILSDIPPNRETISNGKEGFLVD